MAALVLFRIGNLTTGFILRPCSPLRRPRSWRPGPNQQLQSPIRLSGAGHGSFARAISEEQEPHNADPKIISNSRFCESVLAGPRPPRATLKPPQGLLIAN